MTTTSSATSSNSVLNSYLTQQASNVASDTATTSSSSSTTSSATSLNSNLNTFLKILTTQLQHQDPTNATDTNQFTQQLIQFASAEQQINTNTKLDTLINLSKSSSSLAATLGYIGQYAEVSSTGSLALQDGKAAISYTLPSGTQATSISVLDSSGKTVATISGSTTKGTNYVTWDGKNTSGKQMADGAYTFQVNATDKAGDAVTVSDIRVIGKVTAIQSESDGTTSLILGDGLTIGSAKVKAVYSSSAIPDATTTG